MSHAHEVDSSRPLPHGLFRKLMLLCFGLLFITGLVVAHTLYPDLSARAQAWGNTQIATLMGNIHTHAEQIRPQQWPSKLKTAVQATEEALQPVENPPSLPDELFEYADDLQYEQH